MLGEFNIQQFVSAFVVLFAVIDVTGSIPIFLSLRQKNRCQKSRSAFSRNVYRFLLRRRSLFEPVPC